MAKRTGDICEKCNVQMKKGMEIKLVVDITYYKVRSKKYQTRYATLCTDCLKEFVPNLKKFGFKRKKPKIDLGLS